MSTPETQPPAKAAAPAAPERSGAPATLTAKVSDIIDLYSGKEINEPNAVKLAMERPVRLIVTGGPVDYGKTTLLTSLYELFQIKPIAGQRFAGSMTLPAFEQKCHYARLASQNIRIETPRTPYKPDPEYLHLRTSSMEDPTRQTDFLFTDVSGEMFDRATNSESECKQLTFVKRATHLLLLLDTGKAIQSSRWGMLRNAKTLLRSFLDHDMLSPYCVVTVVWSKYDFYAPSTADEKTVLDDFRTKVKDQFEKDFKGRVSDLQFKEIAAQPLEQPRLEFGHGVPELFAGWVSDSEDLRKLKLHPNDAVGTRESELFGQRHQPAETAP